MKNEINLIEGIIEDWHNLADYDGKEKDGESLDTAWAKIKEIIKKEAASSKLQAPRNGHN